MAFVIGHVPWNKGMKGKYSISHAAQFKKGQQSWNKGKKLFKEEYPNYGMRNKRHSNKTINKCKEKNIGKHYSPNTEFKKNDFRITGENNINYGKPIPKEIRKKISATEQGISLDKWKGFVKYENYGEEFNNKLKNEIRKRDNQICMNCGIHREKINRAFDVHHVNYDKKCNFPQNLISLCHKCHSLTNFNRQHWTKFFQSLLTEKCGYQYSENQEIKLNLNMEEK